jgi:hypothetical protein
MGLPAPIDKSALAFGEPKRRRAPDHLRFSQPRALGRKVSDEFTMPLCLSCHRQLHATDDEKR